MRHQSRLPEQYEARNLFNTPGTGRSVPLAITRTVKIPGNREAVHCQDPPRRNQNPPPFYQTPQGHYSNPAENMVAAAARLDTIPIPDEAPYAEEVRNAIGYLRTVMAQQEKYNYSRSRVHSTHIHNRSYNWCYESPAVSSSE